MEQLLNRSTSYYHAGEQGGEDVGKKLLRILMLVHNVAWRGGAFFHGFGFARQLAKMGHSITLLAISLKERWAFHEEEVEGVRLIMTPDLLWGIGRTGWDPWDTLRRVLYLRSRDFDLVHAVDTRPAVVLPALYVRHTTGAKLVMGWADWWGRGGTTSERSVWIIRTLFGPVELFFEEAFRPWADGTITISRALYNRALQMGIPEATMLYLPPGSDIDNILPVPKVEARRRVGLDADRPLVGYLGALFQKDADLLLAAFSVLRKEHRACRLVMIGNCKARIPPEVAEADWLIQTGYVSFEDLVQYLGACDVLVLPLRDTVANRGRWPSKVNDYMAAGRPIVSTAVGDLAGLFKEAHIGLLAEATASDIAEKIGSVLADREAQVTMGQNARRLAETKYSWSVAAGRLEQFYYEMLNVDGQ